MKFAVHHHVTIPDHFDFMIDTGDGLTTFRIIAADMEKLSCGDAVTAQKIVDHDRKYLTYEGPVSCDRGHVSLYDTGEYKALSWYDDSITLTISGGVLKGTISMEKFKDTFFRIKLT